MTESGVNIPLLRKAVEWVEQQSLLDDDVREWDQGVWTAFRVPSKRQDGMFQMIDPAHLRMFGHTTIDPHYADGWTEEELQAVVDRGECQTVMCVAGWIGVYTSDDYKYTWAPAGKPQVEEYAQSQLGLTDEQADELFDGDNTAADVRCIAERIAGEKL